MENTIRETGKNIGYGIPIPAAPSVFDANDPFYGNLTIKKSNFVARVVSAKSAKTAVVLIDRKVYHPKYRRYENRRSKFSVHNPTSINAKEGDIVKIYETRPLSKTKHHVIVQVLGQYVEIKGQDLAAEEIEAAKEKMNAKHATKEKEVKPKKAKSEEVA